MAALAGAQRGINLCQSLLRAQLGQRVNVMILEKALTLELAQFEDSEFYDKLTRARREASSRPLSLVNRTSVSYTHLTLPTISEMNTEIKPIEREIRVPTNKRLRTSLPNKSVPNTNLWSAIC